MRIPSRRAQTKATLDLLRNRTTRGAEYVLATIEQESPRQVLAVEVDLAPVMDALGLVPPSPPGHILEVGPYRFERDWYRLPRELRQVLTGNYRRDRMAHAQAMAEAVEWYANNPRSVKP